MKKYEIKIIWNDDETDLVTCEGVKSFIEECLFETGIILDENGNSINVRFFDTEEEKECKHSETKSLHGMYKQTYQWCNTCGAVQLLNLSIGSKHGEWEFPKKMKKKVGQIA